MLVANFTRGLAMNFEFSEDQKFIQQQARNFLTDRCTPAVVREVLDSDACIHTQLWNEIAGLGWTGTAIPEAYGGLGLGYLELCVIAEELGRTLAPVPMSSSIYLAAEFILAIGTEEQKLQYLPALASGEKIATVALPDIRSGRVITDLECDGSSVSGFCQVVADAGVADYFLVLANCSDAQSPRVYLVESDEAGIEVSQRESIDPSRPMASVVFSGAAAVPVGDGALEATGQLAAVIDRAAVLLAFEQVGGAEACLDMGRAYTTGRYAFGRPVASFQAIKHKFADMFVAIELARSNAYYGAWALSQDAVELPLAAATARVSAVDAYFQCSKENIQAHGGMGFTWEFDCHLYYRRAQHLSLLVGSQRYWKNCLVDRIQVAHSA
jgi:acyl-CoA dehydrogenase